MLNVSPDLYEILSLAMRYVFAFLALFIVLRAYLWLLSDRHERRSKLRKMPNAGTIGELLVLHGSPELPISTFLPVPREGTLGSVRTCDLTVPCPGVRHEHLFFSWEDGAGLLLEPIHHSPLSVNQNTITPSSDSGPVFLRHGDILTIGDATLQLQIYTSLRSASDVAIPVSQESFPSHSANPWPNAAPNFPMRSSGHSAEEHPDALPGSPVPYSGYPVDSRPEDWAAQDAENRVPACDSSCPQNPESVNPVPIDAPSDPNKDWSRYRRPRRSDRWKEDWSE